MDDSEPLIQRASMAMLALVFLGAFMNAPASAKEVPKIITPTATASPMPTNSPTPTATRTPAPTPTITQTPTPTLDPVIDLTAGYSVDKVLIWYEEIKRIIEWEDLNLDPVLVMAIMAAESGGDQDTVSNDGHSSCGLMQVIPQPWYELSAAAICGSAVGNMYQGMYVLRWSLDLAERNGLPLEYGVAFFNCSYDGVMNDRCGTKGGLYYADNVFQFWYPRFVLALEDLQ